MAEPDTAALGPNETWSIVMKLQVFKRGFLRDVLTLAGGTGLAQLIAVGFMPVLSRLYSPAEFGVIAVYAAIVAAASVLATGQYEMAIVLPKRNREARSLLLLGFILSLGSALLATLLLHVLEPFYGAWARAHDAEAILHLVPIGIVLTTSPLLMRNYLLRSRAFSGIASGDVLKEASNGSMALLAKAVFGLGPFGLILGQWIGSLSFLARALGLTGIAPWREDLRRPSRSKEVTAVAKEHAKFPRFTAPAALANSLTEGMPNLILAASFGAETAGLYLVAVRILSMPVKLVGQSVRQVFYEKAARCAQDGGDVRRLLRMTTLRMILTSIVVFGMIAVLAPMLDVWVFGEQWSGLGSVIAVLTIWIGTRFISGPANMVIYIYGLQRGQLIYFVLNTIFRLLILFYCVGKLSFIMSLLIFSGSGMVANLLFLTWVYRAIGSGLEPIVGAENDDDR